MSAVPENGGDRRPEHYVLLEGLKREVAVLITRVDALLPLVEKNARMLQGNGGEEGIRLQISHLQRTDAEMAKKLEALRTERADLPAVREARWRAWAEIAVAVGVVASLLLHLLRAIGS